MTKQSRSRRAAARSQAALRADPADQTIQRFFSALTRMAPNLPQQTSKSRASKGPKS